VIKFNASTVAAKLTDVQAEAVRTGKLDDIPGDRNVYVLTHQFRIFYREPVPGTTEDTFEVTKFGRAVQIALEGREGRKTNE